MVLVEPSEIDMTANDIVSFKDLRRFPNYDRRRLTRTLDQICQRAAIPELDLWQAFEANEPERLYFQQDGHWNDAGQDLAAREVALYIYTERLAGADAKPAPVIAGKPL